MPATAPPGIGTKLRRARIERELSIEETAWRTRIRPDLLRALEEEAFEAIGHQAHVRSHLASYARFLGVDPSEVVDEFESRHEGAPSALEELDRQVSQSRKPPRARWIVASIVCGVVLVAAALAGVLGGQAERTGAPDDVVGPLDAAAANVPVPAAEARVRVEVAVIAATKVSVVADGDQVFEGMLAAGDTRPFRARETLEVVAADGGALRVTHNGEDLGPLGERGSVARARFGPAGRLP